MLGINKKQNNLVIKQENIDDKGKITIEPYNSNYSKKINFEIDLTLLFSKLINLKAEYRNLSYSGIIIFDEKNSYLKKVIILKDMLKYIYLYNMANEKTKLMFEYEIDKIKIINPKNELEPKEVMRVEIKNFNLEDKTELKINDKSISVENIRYPEIKLDNSSLNFYWGDLDKIDKNMLKNIKFISIKRTFSIKKERIKKCFTDFNIFSIYLIFNNKIIRQSDIYYNSEFTNH